MLDKTESKASKDMMFILTASLITVNGEKIQLVVSSQHIKNKIYVLLKLWIKVIKYIINYQLLY